MASGSAVSTTSTALVIAALASFAAMSTLRGQVVVEPNTIDAWLERVAEERGFSGVVLLARGEDVLLNAGYGPADDAGTPMTADTVILTGSISKQFTATAVLLLEERGLLDVEDPLSAFLDEVPADKANVTIHHLLTHTAGFTRDHFRGDLIPMSLDEALATIYALPLGFAPGTEYTYSNTGYAVLAVIVQTVSGRPFVEFMRDEVFARFGLSDTGFFGDDWTRNAVATAYSNGETHGPPSAFPGPFWGNMGNAGVMSTTRDLHRWFVAIRSGEVLSAENTERLFEPHAEVRPGTHYGYGWATTDSAELGRAIGHGGVGLGGNSEVAYYPDHDLTIIVLSNHARWRFEDGAAVDMTLPAREVRDQLVKNLAAGDFSALPEPAGTRRSWIIPVAATLLGLAVVVLLVVRRRAHA